MSKTNIRQYDIDQAYALGNINANSIDLDATDWSYGANFGYHINQYFAVQLEYIDFGERLVKFSGTTLADDLVAFYAAAETVYPETAQGPQISIVLSLPLSNSTKVFAKAGYLDWAQKYKTTDPVLKGLDASSGQDVLMGIGVRYLFREDIVFNLGIETVKLNRHRVNNVYAGIQYFPFADNKPSKKHTLIKKAVPATPISESEQTTTIPIALIDSDGDSVTDALDSCANTPSIEAVDVNSCKRYETETKLMILNLLFALNSSELTQDDLTEVTKLAKFMQKHSNTSLVLEGHTDIRGKALNNQHLSEQRANAVKRELIETHNIASSRVEAIGFGASRLIDPANTETAHTMNRRTVAEISIETSIKANEYK
jgi:outer membrane protein OmpA-like peptidoglycan-associated protein